LDAPVAAGSARVDGAALVFLSLRSKTAKQHRSWLLRRAPVAAGSARAKPRPLSDLCRVAITTAFEIK